MSMKSLDLIPGLEKLPGDHEHRSFRDMLEELRAAALGAEEAVAAASIALGSISDQVNVPDSLIQAYEAQYPGLAAEQSLLQQWQEVQADDQTRQWFLSGLKGSGGNSSRRDA